MKTKCVTTPFKTPSTGNDTLEQYFYAIKKQKVELKSTATVSFIDFRYCKSLSRLGKAFSTGEITQMISFDYTQVPIIISLLIILFGLTFRGIWLWSSLTVAVVFLYITDKESIITLVIYGLTASLLIFGYINIKRGLNFTDLEKSDNTDFTFAVDANNLLGLVEWDLKKFSDFINELERDDMATHLFFDYGIKKTLKNGNFLQTKRDCSNCSMQNSQARQIQSYGF